MESQVVGSFQKNETEEIRVSIRSYKEKLYLDLRLFFQPSGSEERVPSKKGLTLPIELLPMLKESLERAEEAIAQTAQA